MNLNIISFHGLYSQGNNLEILVNALEFDADMRGINTVVSQHDYPVLKLRQGWKAWARDMVAEYILKCLALEYRKFPKALCYVLCHSNGTFGMMNALTRYYYDDNIRFYDKIKVDKVVLFGSVIPCDFDWRRFPGISVANFVGSKDRVSGFAGRLYGMGSSGRHGFDIEAPNLVQYYTDWKHSDFVEPKNYDLIKTEFFRGI